MLWTFAAVAAVLTVTPGPAFALVVRSALRGGQRAAAATIAGNAVGVLVWAGSSVLGISALVAASEAAHDVLRLVGAITLVVIGIQTWRGAGRPPAPARASDRSAFRDGLLTSLANPKLAVFFVALFPQFVPDGAPVLPATLLMATLVVGLDVVWYSAVAFAVGRARDAWRATVARRLERLAGGVLMGLGAHLALERVR